MAKTAPALSDLPSGYGVRLKATRLALGYTTQKELAAEVGVSLARWNNWELEKNAPDLYFMLVLKFKRGIPLDWIYAGDPQALPHAVAQRLVSAGSKPNAPAALKALRATLGIDPTRTEADQTFHERQDAIK